MKLKQCLSWKHPFEKAPRIPGHIADDCTSIFEELFIPSIFKTFPIDEGFTNALECV